MAQKGTQPSLNDPRIRKPNILVDEALDGSCDYSKYKTEPTQLTVTETTETISVLAGNRQRPPISRTTNVLVDQFLDGSYARNTTKQRQPRSPTTKQQPVPQANIPTEAEEQKQAEQQLKGSASQEVVRTVTVTKVQTIEDQIFPPASNPAPPPRGEPIERGAAIKRTPNILVDDILDGKFAGRKPAGQQRPPITPTMKEVSLKASPPKEQVEEKPDSKNACTFLRLVVKKKALGITSFAFSRLLLFKQKTKLLGHRFNMLARVFNHVRARRVGQGFSSILSAGLKRKAIKEPTTPDRSASSTNRLARTTRNRLEKSAASVGEDSQVFTKEEGDKLMILTEQAKEAILKMQRFDRYIYPFESEKNLKVPIEAQLRRLQKIKSGNKAMWNTYYDNELTITCLYNHMKNLYELNRDLSQIDLLKVQNQELQKRIIETNVQKQKQLKEARAGNRQGGGANVTVLNEYKTNTEFLISTLNETNEKARKLLENQLKKATSPHKQLLEVTLDMVNELIQLHEGPNESALIQTALVKIIEQQADSTRSVQYLDRQRKGFEKAIADAKTDQSKNLNQTLLNLCIYLINLHSKLKVLKGQGSMRNMAADNPEKLKADLETERAKIRELESRIQQLNKQKKALEDTKDITVITTWQTQLTTIIEKIEGKEPYQADIVKQRKLIAARKDNKFNGIISVNLNLLQVLSRKEKELERLERAAQDKRPEVVPTKQLEDKLAKEKQQRESVEAQLARISKELEEYKAKEKLRDKDGQPLQNQLNELFKMCTLFEQIITKRDSEAGTGVNTTSIELQKTRKTLQTRKKFSPTLVPIIGIIDSFIRIILDTENSDKKRLQEEERFELQRTKELSGLDGLTKIFMKLIEAESVRVDDGLISRLRKNIDTTNTKLEKGIDSPVSDLYDVYRNFVEVESRLITLLESTMKEAKQAISSQKQIPSPTKKEEQAASKRVQQLQKQLQVERGRYTTKQQEILRLQGQEDALNRRIQQLQKQLELEKGRYATRDQEIANRDQQLKAAREELKNAKNDLKNKEQELQTFKAEVAKKNPEAEKELKSQKEAVQKYVESEKNLNKRIGELEKLEGEAKKQMGDLNRQISELNRTIADLERQLKFAGDHKARLKELTEQLSDANKQIRELNTQLTDSNKTIGELKKKEDQLSKTSTQQQPVLDRLTDENSQLRKTIEQNYATIRDLNGKEGKLNQQIKQLNDKEAKLSQQIRDLTRDLENANKAAKQKAEELERAKKDSQTTQSAETQKAKDELQRNRADLKRSEDELARSRDELQRSEDDLKRLTDELSRLKEDSSKYNKQLNDLRNANSTYEKEIIVLTQTANSVKYLEEANMSLKDENDILRLELLARQKALTQIQTGDNSKAQSLAVQLSQLKEEHTKLRVEYDRTKGLIDEEKKKDGEIIINLKKEAEELKSIINTNEVIFHQVVRDNQLFLNDLNILKANEEHLKAIVAVLEQEKIAGGFGGGVSPDLQAFTEEIRLLKEENIRLATELQNKQPDETSRNEKVNVEMELTRKTNQLSELKSKLDKIVSESSDTLYQEKTKLNKSIREMESKESDLKKLIETNAKLAEQNQKKLNTEISSLKMQLATKSSYQGELERLKSTHIERTILQTRERQLSDKNSQLIQLQKQLAELRKASSSSSPAADRELQDLRVNFSRVQIERNSFEQLFQQKKKDYDIILLELENRTRSENHYRERAEQIQKTSDKLQKQLLEQEAMWKNKIAEAGGLGEISSPNSRYMLVLEEKKLIELEYNQLKSELEKEFTFKRDIEEKFATMLQEKSKFIEKIDTLQKTVHSKELELLRNFELREDSIKEMINQNKKLQKELKQINEKLGTDHKISVKSLQENLSKLETELAQVKKQNSILRDQVEDLQEELEVRSRNRTPKRSSRIQKFHEENNDDKYMLKVEGDKLKDEIYYLECSNEKLKQKIRSIEDASVHSVRSGDSHRRISSHMNLADDRLGHLNERLSDKVKYLERERHTLYQRLKILSIFSRIDTSNHAFIHNLNRVLDNILAFLNESQQFSESIITYGNFISQITESISSENYERYFQNVEDFLKDLFMRTFESKNEVLAKQAAQLIHFREQMSELVNEQIDYIEEEERATPKSSRFDLERAQSDTAGMASFIALRHLFRLYVRAKSPDVLEEIAHLLNVTEMEGAEGMIG